MGETYPKISPEHVICTKSILYPSELMYYDASQGFAFRLFIYDRQILTGPFALDEKRDEASETEKLQNQIVKKIAEMEEAHRKKNYPTLLAPTSSEGSGNMSMWLICDILKADGPSPALYDTFISYYSFSDSGAATLMERDPNALREIVSGRSARAGESLSGRHGRLARYHHHLPRRWHQQHAGQQGYLLDDRHWEGILLCLLAL